MNTIAHTIVHLLVDFLVVALFLIILRAASGLFGKPFRYQWRKDLWLFVTLLVADEVAPLLPGGWAAPVVVTCVVFLLVVVWVIRRDFSRGPGQP